MLCLQPFSECRLCMARYSEKVNKQMFIKILCKTFCRNYICKKKKSNKKKKKKGFILFIFFFFFFFFLNRKIPCFYIVKMDANYEKINSEGSLNAGFQQVPLGQNF